MSEAHMEKHGYLLPIIINIAEYRLLTLGSAWQCHTVVELHHEMDSTPRHLFRETNESQEMSLVTLLSFTIIHCLLGHGICSELKMQN